MAINGISFGNTILGGSIQNLKTQMADLQNQLTSGKRRLPTRAWAPTKALRSRRAHNC